MLLSEQLSSWMYAFCKGKKEVGKCYYQPLCPTQRKLLQARQFAPICWKDRVKTNKKSKNQFPPTPAAEGKNLWVCWVWNCGITRTTQLSFSYKPYTLQNNSLRDRKWENILSSHRGRDGAVIRVQNQCVTETEMEAVSASSWKHNAS